MLRVNVAGGDAWVVKTYRHSPMALRKTLGRYWTRREYRIMTALSGMGSIPKDPWLLDACSLCCRYEAGRTLLDIRKNPVPVSRRFFLLLEQEVREMHARGFAHLDLRNGRNMLIRDDMTPVLLDFQSCIGLKLLPAGVRRLVCNVDLSGVYKWWNRLSPETMDEARFNLYRRLDRKRVLWPFKGYGGLFRLWNPEPPQPCGKQDERRGHDAPSPAPSSHDEDPLTGK